MGSVRRLLRLRYLPSLQLAVVSRFSLRCWPPATKNCTPPSLWSPSHTRHQPRPRSYAARLCFRCHHSARRLSRRHPPLDLKKNPYYRTIARARSRPRGNVRWELDFCINSHTMAHRPGPGSKLRPGQNSPYQNGRKPEESRPGFLMAMESTHRGRCVAEILRNGTLYGACFSRSNSDLVLWLSRGMD